MFELKTFQRAVKKVFWVTQTEFVIQADAEEPHAKEKKDSNLEVPQVQNLLPKSNNLINWRYANDYPPLIR